MKTLSRAQMDHFRKLKSCGYDVSGLAKRFGLSVDQVESIINNEVNATVETDELQNLQHPPADEPTPPQEAYQPEDYANHFWLELCKQYQETGEALKNFAGWYASQIEEFELADHIGSFSHAGLTEAKSIAIANHILKGYILIPREPKKLSELPCGCKEHHKN